MQTGGETAAQAHPKLAGAHIALVGGAAAQAPLLTALGEVGALVRTCTNAAGLAELDWDGDVVVLLPPLADDADAACALLADLAVNRPHAWRLLATGRTDPTHLIRAVNQGRVNAVLPWPCPLPTVLDHCAHGTGRSRARPAPGTQRLGAIQQLERALQEARQQLADQQQRSNLGHLVRGLAHEFNNPLAAIMGHGERLQRLVKDDEKLRRRAGIVVEEARRCSELVDRLRQFASPPPASTQVCDPLVVLRHAMARLGETHTVLPRLRIGDGVQPVVAAPEQLGQAFLQIVDNARLAGAGEILLRARDLDDSVRLLFSNDGETPSTDVIRQAVSPFFTTRGEQGHRGLGLSLAAALIRDMGGSLTVDRNELGPGLCCQITLPRPAGRGTAVFGSDRAAAGKRILLVDDEPLINELISDVLGTAGCDVTVTQNLAAARQRLRGDDYAAVICDVTLPDGSGTAFLAELVDRRPELAGHIAIVTGAPDDQETARCVEELDCPLLAKPFRIHDIQHLVERIL